MYEDDKKYHMDLKENARGRFLKVSETFSRGNSRDQVTCKNSLYFYNHFPLQVFIPADGMVEVQQNLRELLDEFDLV